MSKFLCSTLLALVLALVFAPALMDYFFVPAPLPPPEDTWALVTGASSGIGKDIAIALGERGFNLVLTARRTDRLSALAEELGSLGVDVISLPADLVTPNAVAELYAETRRRNLDISIIVSNAGLALTGQLGDLGEAEIRNMLMLNVVASTSVVETFAADLVAKGRGRVLLVSSVAGTCGIRKSAVYAASKAYLRHHARSLRLDLGPRGVGVTALLPGATDTEFAEVANMEQALIFTLPFARATGMVLSARYVAQKGVEGLLRGTREVIPGFVNLAVVFVAETLPSSFADRLASMVFEPAPHWLRHSAVWQWWEQTLTAQP